MENGNTNTKLRPTPVKLNDQDPIYDIKEAADYLKLSKASVYILASNNSIPSYKRGRKIYFFKSELTAWIKEGERKNIKEDNSNPLLE